MRQAILLLALITPAARSCFDETRGGCFTAGFVDNLSSADDCQAACAFDSACNYFAYHSARGDRRCHFCHDDRDVSQCAANVGNYVPLAWFVFNVDLAMLPKHSGTAQTTVRVCLPTRTAAEAITERLTSPLLRSSYFLLSKLFHN